MCYQTIRAVKERKMYSIIYYEGLTRHEHTSNTLFDAVDFAKWAMACHADNVRIYFEDLYEISLQD